jgi:hypothetical protein
MSQTPLANDIEYEDAYVIEEKTIKYEDLDDDKLFNDIQDNLELDSLDLSDEEALDEITADYDKMKIASDQSKKKIEKSYDKKGKIIDLKPKVVKREEVVEDFIRNFFTKYSLIKVLDEFNVRKNNN